VCVDETGHDHHATGVNDFSAGLHDVATDSFDHVTVNQEVARCEVKLKVQ
jgi:hypothetical protein